MAKTIAVKDFKAHEGEHLGNSDWHEVTQEQVNMFADATGDHQWIHCDPERAKSGPFGGTIAHGYLTMSLIPGVLHEVWNVTGMRMGLNYGINKLRFPAPVPVGSKVRVDATLAKVEEVGGGGFQTTLGVTVEIEGQDKPGCVAEVLYRYYPED
jgi:acyl dehydratase